MMDKAWLICAIGAMLFAGCVNDPQDLSIDTASLKYDGQDSGTHSDGVDCDDDGQLTGSGQVDDGRVSVAITDASGDEVWAKEFSGSIDVQGIVIRGASGQWTMKAERSGNDLVGDDFNGDYSFTLAC